MSTKVATNTPTANPEFANPKKLAAIQAIKAYQSKLLIYGSIYEELRLLHEQIPDNRNADYWYANNTMKEVMLGALAALSIPDAKAMYSEHLQEGAARTMIAMIEFFDRIQDNEPVKAELALEQVRDYSLTPEQYDNYFDMYSKRIIGVRPEYLQFIEPKTRESASPVPQMPLPDPETDSEILTSNYYQYLDLQAKLHTFDYDMSTGTDQINGGPLLKVQAITFRRASDKQDPLKDKYDDIAELVKVEHNGADITDIVFAQAELYQEIFDIKNALSEKDFSALTLSDSPGFKVDVHEWDHQWKTEFKDGSIHQIMVIATIYEASIFGRYCTYPVFHEILVDGKNVDVEEVRGILDTAFYIASGARVKPEQLEKAHAWEWDIVKDSFHKAPATKVKAISKLLNSAA